MTLVQNVKSGVALIDETGRFAVVNPSFMQIFGLDSELDILNINSQEWSRWEVYGEDGKLLHVDDHPVRKAVRTGKPVKDQLVAVRNPEENELTWMLISAEPVMKENGHIYRIICTYHDITERKRAEEALRKSEERFRALVTASSEVVYRVSPDWSEMRQLYGRGFLADTEIPSSSWLQEYVPPEDQPRVTAVVNEAISTKSTYQLEHRVRLADGSLGWIFSRAVPMLNANGEIVEWFGAASDITERKRAEEALRESEERLRLLGDNLPNSAVYQYIHEPDGSVRFLYFSTGIERLNGINVQDVLRDPSTLYRQVPPEYLERVFEAEALSARELSDFDMEVPMRLPDGQEKWMRLHSRPRRLHDGRKIWDGVQIDVTK